MKTSIVAVWGEAAHNRRKIIEATSDRLMEATNACLDILVQAQHDTGIHGVCAVGALKVVLGGYSSEIRWSERGDHWWTPQRTLLLLADHDTLFEHVYASGDVYMPVNAMSTDELVAALAAGLATKYVR